MIGRFLVVKHWQIFLISIGIPIAAQCIFMPLSIAGNIPWATPLVFCLTMTIAIFGLFGWFWSVAVGLQHKIPSDVKMRIKVFKAIFIFTLLYLFFVLISLFIPWNTTGADANLNSQDVGNLPAIVIPIHLFAMFCIFYCAYYVAKTIVTTELKRKATFSDFAGEFFMIWFYPIGIWILQPRINKLNNSPPAS